MIYRILLVCAALSAMAMAADVITFRDGKTATGSYLGGDSRQVRMVVGEKIQSYSIPDIVKIEFGTAATSAGAPPAAAPVERRESLQPSRVENANAPAAATPTVGEIQVGTNLVIRLIDPVDSETDRVGQTYRASLDEPVILSGETLVPRGADITAKLVDDQQAGRLSGQTVLTLDLVSMSVNGRTVDINTEEVTQAGASRTKSSAKVIGGIAALGAIIGGIAGGGKGAAVGAVSGAGAGTAVQVLTKGPKVKIRPRRGSRSRFRIRFVYEGGGFDGNGGFNHGGADDAGGPSAGGRKRGEHRARNRVRGFAVLRLRGVPRDAR